MFERVAIGLEIVENIFVVQRVELWTVVGFQLKSNQNANILKEPVALRHRRDIAQDAKTYLWTVE